MLKSGNGRHRKPRQASTAMVAVAATGAGMALPLFAASGAQAADNDKGAVTVSTTVWNAVALCESGGLWSSDTGNGFYGGLQITSDTWDEYGGQEYAERPDLASQNQQISVAENILGEIGPEAWPTCADTAGLTAAVAGADADDTTTDEPTDSATGGATDGAADGTTDGTADETAGTDDAASPGASATDSPSPSASPSTPAKSQGRHAKPDTTGTTAATGQVAEAKAAWGVLARSTTATAGTTKATTKAARTDAASTTAGTKHYLVQEGDTLCEIAAEEDVDGGWRALYEANKAAIGDDPSVIRAGEYLTVG